MSQNPWLGWLLIILLLWSLPWKVMALWRSARNDHKVWFVILLIFNTAGILEIIYLLFFGAKNPPAGVAEKVEATIYPESGRRPIV